MNYEDLPENLQQELFKRHTHGELVKPEEIVIREKDVIDLLVKVLSGKIK